ncbi:MAG: dockerin type I repeat-containing protein, partial [Ruminococcus sp.]|nr:dockerin type I repeat-containing protein [Ruminococcus sp.]
NNHGNTDVCKKTDNGDIITITKELSAGKYTFNMYNLSTDKSYGKNNTVITDTTNRLVLVNSGDACVLNATGGTYEFKYELSTNRLSIYSANKTADCTGDVNADGKFNVADVVLLQKWLLAVSNVTLPDWKAADLCEDNKIDVFDMIEMRKLIVNK